MPDLKNRLFRLYLNTCFPSDFSGERSVGEQQKHLHNIIQKLSNTALGKDVGLPDIKTYEEFRNTVPTTFYDFYQKYIERIKAGEQKVMTHEKVLWFGKTAGTNGGSKYIPITQTIIRHCHVRGTFFGLSRLHSFDKDIDILSHKNFVMAGGVYETLQPSGIGVADISAIMMRHVPWPFRTIYSPDNALITHASWEHKLTHVPQEVVKADVGALLGVPTWHLAVLSKIREQVNFNTLNDIWKNARFFFHGGVNFEPYREHFKKLVGRRDFIFYEIYNATEGFFGVQSQLDGGGLILLTDNQVFYEFIPFSEYGTTHVRAIPLSEVKPGIPYAMLVTTINGLLRYVLGDVVTFTSTDPYTFKITGRTQEYINAFGEDLLLSHVLNALMRTNDKFNSTIREYTVAPYYIELNKKGRIQFVIEFIHAPADIGVYERELDAQLQIENSNYKQKRNNDLALTHLEVIQAKEGTFYNWLKSKGKLGGQNKVPKLVNNRNVIEEVLACLQ